MGVDKVIEILLKALRDSDGVVAASEVEGESKRTIGVETETEALFVTVELA